MNEWVLAIFAFATASIFYTYFGYPVALWLLSRMFGSDVHKASYQPPVTIVLAVHNEEQVLRSKLENLLGLSYPKDKLEVIVVSDGSTDQTNQIVNEFASRGVRLVYVLPRRGKHFAQKEGIEQSRGEILVFTDAAAMLEADTLSEMVMNYHDPRVGSVSSIDRVLSHKTEMSREQTYIEYDMNLRQWESRLSSTTGMSGSLFSARRDLCNAWWLDRSSDFFVALESVRQGYRAVLDSESVHYYGASQSLEHEFQRKERTILNGMVVMLGSLSMFNLFRYGFFSWQLFSHKLCRWCMPLALLLVFVSSGVLAVSSLIFGILVALQVTFYTLALLGVVYPSLNSHPAIRTASFFCVANAAIGWAWIELARGQKRTVWDPTRRP